MHIVYSLKRSSLKDQTTKEALRIALQTGIGLSCRTFAVHEQEAMENHIENMTRAGFACHRADFVESYSTTTSTVTLNKVA